MSTSPSEEIQINMKVIASKLKCKVEEILSLLVALDARGLLLWSPNNGNLKISWPSARMDSSKITTDSKRMSERMSLLISKLENVNDYSNSKECRSVLLEKYLASNSAEEECGKCDNCTWDPKKADDELRKILQSESGICAYELIRKFNPGHRLGVSQILRKHLDSGFIYTEGTKVFIASQTS